jgi:hypothetical protein
LRKVGREVKVLIKNLAIFFYVPAFLHPWSQQAVSADIIANAAVGIFPQKQKEQRHKQLGYTDKLVTTHI